MTLPSPTPIFAAMLCVLACGCKPAGNSTDELQSADVPAATAPAAASPAPVTPGNTAVAYQCTDGSTVQASYGDHDATLRWPDGRSVQLPRAESASTGGGDVYVGESVSLQRDASHIELHDGDATPVTCNAGG